MCGHKSADFNKMNNNEKKSEKAENAVEDNDLVLCILTSKKRFTS